MSDEGVVRFRAYRTPGPPPSGPDVDLLLDARHQLVAAGLIGALPDGTGYGNISVRSGDGVIVTGTGTGGITALGPEGLTRVTGCDIEGNIVRCTGPVDASSETMTHMAAYAASGDVGAVAHGHHDRAWERLCGMIPTTDAAIPYGTPQMARAVEEIVRRFYTGIDLVIAMAGHRGGLLAAGTTPEVALSALLAAVERG